MWEFGGLFLRRTGTRACLFPVQEKGDHGGKNFRDPEGVPYAGGAHKTAQHKGQGKDQQSVAKQGDHKGGASHSQAFQRSACNDGDRGNHKSQADDAQGGAAQGNGAGLGGEHPDELARNQPAKRGSHRHNTCGKNQRRAENFLHSAVLSGAEIVADDGAHPLDNPVGGQIQEGLQLT